MLNYAQVLRAGARTHGTRMAIEDASSSYSYREVDVATAQLASGLRKLGLQPGDSVIWLSPNTASHPIAHWATARAGLRFSPLNYYLRPEELRAAIEIVQPKLVLAHNEYIETVAPLADDMDIEHRYVVDTNESVGSWPSWKGLFDHSASTEDDLGDFTEALHEIIFTSGTTGQVKGVIRSQRNRLLGAHLTTLLIRQGPDAWVLRGSPQFHVGGSSGPIETLLQGGRTMFYKFRPTDMIEYIKAGVTHLSGVPAQYAMLFDSGLLDGVDVSGIRGCSIGGNAAAPEQFLQIQRAFPNAELVHVYGSTESGLITVIKGDEFMQRLTSVGRPVAGVEVRIVDDAERDVPRGEVGEIIVRSEMVMSEYLRREDLTKAAFTPDGFLRMGDLARQDDEGYVYIVGRKKDMIITGGENVFPKEVEDVITDLDFVAEVAVVGAPDPVFEERVLAVVRLDAAAVRRDGAGLDEVGMAEQVQALVRTRLAGYKSPKNVFFVEDFPRNALGKIDKVALRDAYKKAAKP